MMPSFSERSHDFDPVWDDIYGSGRQANRYPWDAVVSFVYRHRPREIAPSDIAILEIGCGTAPNLWFAAREGFRVAGIDGSVAAIAAAQARFAKEGLAGDLQVGNFSQLPFADSAFDLAIDRAALSCVGDNVARLAVGELHRTLRPGGVVFCNTYGDRHSSRASGRPGPEGVTIDIAAGTLVGVGQIRFYSRNEMIALFAEPRWSVLALEHVATTNVAEQTEHAEWRLIARRI
jgi:SAM-dependent methyltransferase